MQEAALTGVDLARLVGVRVVQSVQVPTPVGGEPRNRVGAVGDQSPQPLGGPHSPRVPAAHPHDRDRLVGRLLQLAVQLSQPVGFLEGSPQCFDDLVGRRGHCRTPKSQVGSGLVAVERQLDEVVHVHGID